jgi:hypothetical protein
MVIRLISVSDHRPLPELHDVFHAIFGWNGDLGYIIRVHGEEFNSFRRKTRSKALHEFKLHRQEKFLYVCDTLHNVGVGRSRPGHSGRGRTATTRLSVWAAVALRPPEFCGGSTGYRLMLKRQREGAAMSDPVRLEAGIQMLAEAWPGQPAEKVSRALIEDCTNSDLCKRSGSACKKPTRA